MRNWIKQIRDPDYESEWSDEHNDIMFRLRNGKHVGYGQLMTVTDLQACQTPGGPYPPEPDMQTALTDTHLYVTDPSRNEFHVIELY